jgi:hypothetical protein
MRRYCVRIQRLPPSGSERPWTVSLDSPVCGAGDVPGL